MIMPGWGTNLFRRPALSHLAGLVPVSRDPAVLDPGESKTALFLRLLEGTESCRENLPPFVTIDFDQPGYCLTGLIASAGAVVHQVGQCAGPGTG